MRSRLVISTVAVVATLLVLAGGLLAFDRTRADRIAEGVRIGGVDVGGLSRAQAAAKLREDVLAGLQRPIVVQRGGRRWTLSAKRARVAVDIDALVDRALARSREGTFLSRGLRELSGGAIHVNLQPTVRYSRAAVASLLDRVRARVERPAKDASVRFTASGLHTEPSRDGLTVQVRELERQIRAAIVSPTAPRAFVASTRRIEPQVSTEDLADRYPSAIVVDRARFRLTLYKRLQRAKTYSIAVGKAGLETPAGLYTIQNKAKNPAWHVPDSDWAGELAGKVIPPDDPKNPIKARWMGIYDGAGIHGTDATDSIGTAASHGCIRMRIPDVERLYEEVPIGAPVYIA